MVNEKVDIKENNIYKISEKLLSALLVDKTTKKNIIWATDNYKKYGKGYSFKDKITIEKITGLNGNIIKPRIKKSKEEQQYRTKQKAEVFTPSWICNNMNNLIDESLLYKNAFNSELPKEKKWKSTKEKIKFDKRLSWEQYINTNVLEITCGEAPYLVSRYDTTTGDILEIRDRIGLLDRKLRIVNENIEIDDKEKWLLWAKNAYKHTYGFEWQGDSLLIARENLLYTFKDYYIERFNMKPDEKLLLEMAEIISYNIWQMDGLKGVIPLSCKKEVVENQKNLIDMINEANGIKVENKKKTIECQGCKGKDIIANIKKHNGIYSKIMDWDENKMVRFVDCVGK